LFLLAQELNKINIAIFIRSAKNLILIC